MISFQTFFVWAPLLIVQTWNSSPLRSTLLRLQCTCCTVPTTFGRPHGSPLVWTCQWHSSQPLSSPQLPHNDSLWALEISQNHREQDAPKAVWSISYVSVAFFPSLKHNFIAYRSSKMSSRPDCIFEIHHLWQSGFCRVYSNCCCSCWFEPEIIKIGQSSHKMYSNNILNFQESPTILNAHTKKVCKLIVCTSYAMKGFGIKWPIMVDML